MFFNKNLTIILVLFCFFSAYSQSENESKEHFEIQINNRDTNILKYNVSFQNLQIKKMLANSDFNILIGGTQAFGDIRNRDFLPSYDEEMNFFDIQPSIEISITKHLNHILAIQTSFITGKFGGLKREKIGEDYEVYEPYPGFYEGNGEYFITNFKELDFQIILNLTNALSLFTTPYNNKYSFYLKTGIGINTFNSINRNLGSGNYIYSYGYKEGVYLQNSNFEKLDLRSSPRESTYILGLFSKYEINEKLSLIFDLTKRKAYTDLWDSHNNNAKDDNFNFYAVGFSYKISSKPDDKWITPLDEIQNSLNTTKAKINWLNQDTDSDGVSDVYDKEINTPLGVSVDGSGKALDVDMDNVPDYLDKEPFSNKGAIVDKYGVEFDSDFDGVPDSKDLEAKTLVGSIVNEYGISIGSNYNNLAFIPSIYFEKSSSYINSSNASKLANIAIMMHNNDNIKLIVIGNADNNGTSKNNYQIALKRAQETASYLSSNFNIDIKRFVIQSNGDKNNIIKKLSDKQEIKTKFIDEINRRVDFKIFD
ncbi:MAG: hypothetical protein CMP51_03455 [Flavobacteriales bacterium]|nr:hypothetical protein [Flavobacteriales bacterium]